MSDSTQSGWVGTDSHVQQWVGSIGLGAVVAVAYFVTAHLSLGLVLQPEGVAVFWPAAGITTGLLIALGPRARWPVAAGAFIATVAAHILREDPLWAGAAFGLCNAGEPLIAAGLIERWFGAGFRLNRVRHVLGLFVAALAATLISGIGGALTYRLVVGPSAEMLTSLWHWLASDAFGIVTVAPVLIGVAAAVRRRPQQSEIIEGTAAFLALAALTVIIISLPQKSWQTLLPIAWLFPVLVWLAARSPPVFVAAGAFLVSISIVWTTVFGIGHFGDGRLPITDRLLQADAAISVVAIGAFILSALFTERRESEARLARANAMLERERDNKLLNARAITATIAHEIRQPLVAITTNASAAVRWLGRTPPDFREVRSALDRVQSEGQRASEVFDNIRSLFGKVDQEREPVDLNNIVLDVFQSLQGVLQDHAVMLRRELTADLPLIPGHQGQLREVVFNLVNNAVEAMNATTDRNRILTVKTRLSGGDAAVISVKDSGPGIDPKHVDRIFSAFVTTKAHGTGLGLAICRMIIEHHGGQLTALSDGKSGATFEISLPIKP